MMHRTDLKRFKVELFLSLLKFKIRADTEWDITVDDLEVKPDLETLLKTLQKLSNIIEEEEEPEGWSKLKLILSSELMLLPGKFPKLEESLQMEIDVENIEDVLQAMYRLLSTLREKAKKRPREQRTDSNCKRFKADLTEQKEVTEHDIPSLIIGHTNKQEVATEVTENEADGQSKKCDISGKREKHFRDSLRTCSESTQSNSLNKDLHVETQEGASSVKLVRPELMHMSHRDLSATRPKSYSEIQNNQDTVHTQVRDSSSARISSSDQLLDTTEPVEDDQKSNEKQKNKKTEPEEDDQGRDENPKTKGIISTKDSKELMLLPRKFLKLDESLEMEINVENIEDANQGVYKLLLTLREKAKKRPREQRTDNKCKRFKADLTEQKEVTEHNTPSLIIEHAITQEAMTENEAEGQSQEIKKCDTPGKREKHIRDSLGTFSEQSQSNSLNKDPQVETPEGVRSVNSDRPELIDMYNSDLSASRLFRNDQGTENTHVCDSRAALIDGTDQSWVTKDTEEDDQGSNDKQIIKKAGSEENDKESDDKQKIKKDESEEDDQGCNDSQIHNVNIETHDSRVEVEIVDIPVLSTANSARLSCGLYFAPPHHVNCEQAGSIQYNQSSENIQNVLQSQSSDRKSVQMQLQEDGNCKPRSDVIEQNSQILTDTTQSDPVSINKEKNITLETEKEDTPHEPEGKSQVFNKYDPSGNILLDEPTRDISDNTLRLHFQQTQKEHMAPKLQAQTNEGIGCKEPECDTSEQIESCQPDECSSEMQENQSTTNTHDDRKHITETDALATASHEDTTSCKDDNNQNKNEELSPTESNFFSSKVGSIALNDSRVKQSTNNNHPENISFGLSPLYNFKQATIQNQQESLTDTYVSKYLYLSSPGHVTRNQQEMLFDQNSASNADVIQDIDNVSLETNYKRSGFPKSIKKNNKVTKCCTRWKCLSKIDFDRIQSDVIHLPVEQKKALIKQHVLTAPCSRTSITSRRYNNRRYHLPTEGSRTEICKVTFMRLLGISSDFIDTVFKGNRTNRRSQSNTGNDEGPDTEDPPAQQPPETVTQISIPSTVNELMIGEKFSSCL